MSHESRESREPAGTRNDPVYARLLESTRSTRSSIAELISFFVGVAIIHHFLPKFGVDHVTFWDTFWITFAINCIVGENLVSKFTESS